MHFFKYHGTGNDFIILNDEKEEFPDKDIAYIKSLCRRKFGIGADGLILIRPHAELDFMMLYFNADGKPGSLCGNGGRCATAFAQSRNYFKKEAHFEAFDGKHKATVREDGKIALRFHATRVPEKKEENVFVLNTGSPHYVKFVEEDPGHEFVEKARKIRQSEPYSKDGINVNFAWQDGNDRVILRTFERGVEDETYSCGTGSVASAIAFAELKGIDYNGNPIETLTYGGALYVSFERGSPNSGYDNIWLIGPTQFVFKGDLPKRSNQ